jgi:transposase
LRFDLEADQIIFDDYLAAVEHVQERLSTLEAHMADYASREPYREPVEWLRTFRGIDTITAMIIVSELHDFRRFTSPRQLMAYLGLVPSERSSGEKELRGRITKAGNSHVRRILVEAAWNYRHRPIVTQHLAARRHGKPGWVLRIAEKAQHRLHRKYWKMTLAGKSNCKAVVACARELAGFVWAVLYPNAVHSNEDTNG